MARRFIWDDAERKAVENPDWDRRFVAYDDEPRWVGACWPSSDWLESLRDHAAHAAGRLADAVLDETDELTLNRARRDYAKVRAELRHTEEVCDRLYSSAPGWEFPGALVRQ